MFPSLPGPVNAAGAAGSAASGAASVFNAIQSAANQESDRKQRRDAAQAVADHQGQMDLVHALEQGWIPADAPPTTLPGGLKDRTKPSMENQDPGRIVTVGGERLYKPSDLQAGKSYVPSPGSLLYNLHIANGWDGKTPLTAAESHSLAMAVNEAAPKKDPWHVDLSGKFTGKDGKPAPVIMNEATGEVRLLNLGGGEAAQPSQPAQPVAAPASGGGMPGGAFDLTRGLDAAAGQSPESAFAQRPSQASQTTAAPGARPSPGIAAPTSFALPVKPPKEPKAPKNLHFETHTNDKGDVTTLGYDPETMKLVSTHVEQGIGKKTKVAKGATEKPPSPAQFRLVVNAKAKALKDANAAYAKAITPIGGAGGVAVPQETKDEASLAMRKAHQQAQLDYEEGIAALTGKEVPHNDWADKALDELENPPEAAAPAKRTAAPAQTAAAPEETIITNPTTKQRMIKRGGKWQPLK